MADFASYLRSALRARTLSVAVNFSTLLYEPGFFIEFTFTLSLSFCMLFRDDDTLALKAVKKVITRADVFIIRAATDAAVSRSHKHFLL